MDAPPGPVKVPPANWNQTPFDRAFRGGGPLLKALLSVIFVLLVMEVFDALSGELAFAEDLADFLRDALLPFFLIFLLGFYFGYGSRRSPKVGAVLSPLVTAIIVTFWLWVLAMVLDLVGGAEGVTFLQTLSDLVRSILYIVFLLILLLGYIGVIMRAEQRGGAVPVPPPMQMPVQPAPSVPPAPPQMPVPPPSPPSGPQKRLVRSSRNKVLLGVCGGMAEYLDIEPFLIRALWVVGTVVTVGGLIVVYIILGIVLPKGP